MRKTVATCFLLLSLVLLTATVGLSRRHISHDLPQAMISFLGAFIGWIADMTKTKRPVVPI